MKTEDQYHIDTRLIHGKRETTNWDYSHHLVPPVSASATFKLDSVERGAQGFLEFAHTDSGLPGKQPILIYERLGEPNKNMLEEHLAIAEQGEMALTFASGMAAISGILATLCMSGDEIVHHHTLYGCTYSLLTNWFPRFGITTRQADMRTVDRLKAVITSKTRVIYFETPVNPTLDIIDIAEMAAVIREENSKRGQGRLLYMVVDNTFATPVCQRPLTLGADFVVHSLTKNIGGFGTDMGGAVIGKSFVRDLLLLYRKDFGGVLSFHSAWTHLVYGLPTLNIRVRKQELTAIAVADYLSKHPMIEKTHFPGLASFPGAEVAKRQMVSQEGKFAPGTMLYFVIKGDSPADQKEKGRRLMNHLASFSYTITLAVSLGNIKTLIEHPGSMTHSAIPAEEQVNHGMDPGGIRISIGLEDPADIIRDLDEAFRAI